MVKVEAPNNPQISQASLTFTRRLSETVSGTKCQILKEQGSNFAKKQLCMDFSITELQELFGKLFGALQCLAGFLGSSWAEYLQVSSD